MPWSLKADSNNKSQVLRTTICVTYAWRFALSKVVLENLVNEARLTRQHLPEWTLLSDLV